MTRHRSLVLASLPQVCICAGQRRMALVALDGMRGAGVVRCPHCAAAPDLPIPILTLPMRDDTPGDAA